MVKIGEGFFLGLHELIITADFGLSSLSVPNHYFNSKAKGLGTTIVDLNQQVCFND